MMKRILIIFIIVFVFCLSIFLHKFLKINNVKLDKITNIESQELMQVMELNYFPTSIQFESLIMPRNYKDKYYKIYFYITAEDYEKLSTSDRKIHFSTIVGEKNISFEKVKTNKGKIQLCCTVSSIVGNNIEFLEKIYNKYRM